MKPLKKRVPALVLLILAAAGFGLAFSLPRTNAMAESAARGDSEMAQVQAVVDGDNRRCETREVEADEGYGVSHKEIRRICR